MRLVLALISTTPEQRTMQVHYNSLALPIQVTKLKYKGYLVQIFGTDFTTPLLKVRCSLSNHPSKTGAEAYFETLKSTRNYLNSLLEAIFLPESPSQLKIALPIQLVLDMKEGIKLKQPPYDKDLVSLEQLRLYYIGLYPLRLLSDILLRRPLREIGAVPVGPLRIPNGRTSLWAIRNVQHWSETSVAEIREHYIGIKP